MASGHLISLPSLSASEENGRKETTSPTAPYVSRPAHTVELCRLTFLSQKACGNPQEPCQHYPSVQVTSPVKPLPPLQPTHFYPSEHPELLFFVPLTPPKYISQALPRALRDAKVKGEDDTIPALEEPQPRERWMWADNTNHGKPTQGIKKDRSAAAAQES